MEGKNRCVIITANIEGRINSFAQLCAEDYIICADGGYGLAVAENISPNLLIGDFDSQQELRDYCCEVIRVKREKDDTDSMLCLKHGMELGFEDFLIIGGIGGSFGHTFSNIQMLNFAVSCSKRVVLLDKDRYVTVIRNGSISIPRREGASLSVFSLSDVSTGVCEKGVKYPLENATMENSKPIGVSNEFAAPEAEIAVGQGSLLIIVEN